MNMHAKLPVAEVERKKATINYKKSH